MSRVGDMSWVASPIMYVAKDIPGNRRRLSSLNMEPVNCANQTELGDTHEVTSAPNRYIPE